MLQKESSNTSRELLMLDCGILEVLV